MGLERFTQAQDAGDTFAIAVAELRSGQKRSHWMWFVFPQIAGLGRSAMARKYAIRDGDEARTYLAHPILGPRLNEATQAVLDSNAASATTLMGQPDDMKLWSSMTLFAQQTRADPVFTMVIERYFDGRPDEQTVLLL